MSETKNTLQSKAFQPTHSNPSWDRLSLIMPSVYANTMSFYEALQGVIDSVNDTRQDMNDLVDWTNERDDELVKYLNKQIEDFTNANNEFYQKVDNLVQKFITDETAAREQFEQDITNLVNEYKQYLDEKYAQFTAEITEKFNNLKNQFDALKTAVDTFMHDMTAAFEAFKQEIRDLVNQYHDENEQFKTDLEAWKTATFNYFMGQYDTIKAALEARLPDIVAEKLPTILADYAGICLYYDPETRKLNVGYADGLARNGDNKLIATGGGGTGGDTISAGNGIVITDVDGTKRVAVKIGQNLSFSDDGTLNATGGDTISAGNGIGITDENGVKRVAVKIGQNLSFSEDGTLNASGAEVPIATADTVGIVKTGDKTKTGLTISADGTISINQWTPIDVTKDFEFFDKNMTNVAPLWTLDMHYQPKHSSEEKTLYVRMSQDAINTLGIPTNASIINWTPDKAWRYNTTPLVQSISTDGLLSNSTFKVTIKSDVGPSCLRNGTGTIQFSWQGKENVSTLQFKVIKSEMKLDPLHPISIGGTPIANNDTFKFNVNNWQRNLSFSFNMADGTSISDYENLRGGGYAYAEEGRFEITNDCISASYFGFAMQPHNIANGQVIFYIKPDALGLDTGTGYETIITFNVEYDAQEIFNTWSITLSSDTLVNFGTTGIIQLNIGRYEGAQLVVTVDDEHILGIDRYNGKSTTMSRRVSKELYPNRNGTATITVTTPYVSTLNLTKTVTVTENDVMKPHVKVTTDSTQVGDTSRDIANPATVDVSNLAKFSKSQGMITFWTSPAPQKSYFNDKDSTRLKIGSTVNRWFNGWANTTMSYDFSTFNVGDKLSIQYEGNEWRGAYEVIFGEVVE